MKVLSKDSNQEGLVRFRSSCVETQDGMDMCTALQWRALAIQPCFGHCIAFEYWRHLLPYFFVIRVHPLALVGGRSEISIRLRPMGTYDSRAHVSTAPKDKGGRRVWDIDVTIVTCSKPRNPLSPSCLASEPHARRPRFRYECRISHQHNSQVLYPFGKFRV